MESQLFGSPHQQNTEHFANRNLVTTSNQKGVNKERYMKTVRFIAALMFFAAIAAVPSLAQTGAAPTQATTRVGIIDTSVFADEKRGIQKFISAYKQLETEFIPRRTEITGIENRLKTIQADFTKMQTEAAKPGSPVSAESVQKKLDEGQ
ncbi:MAG TPA: hypothetical protein VEQ34_01555, partial [Pyrinomonadaceae bacterium]|nr:hypothetical protein [Pyrinomonadaceae bacterium]